MIQKQVRPKKPDVEGRQPVGQSVAPFVGGSPQLSSSLWQTGTPSGEVLKTGQGSLATKRKPPFSGTYQPHSGYIGKKEVSVPNYLIQSKGPSHLAGPVPYTHCQSLVEELLERPVELQFQKSAELTHYLKKREMTFSKRLPDGDYQIFAVPCTTTPLTLPLSTFQEIERSAQVLVASLRLVLQDLYGSESVRSSKFVKSLPQDLRKQFIQTVENSPHYFPQLHHPVMAKYPFFDVVGLDLVLTEDLTLSQNSLNPAGASARPVRVVNSHLDLASEDPRSEKISERQKRKSPFQLLEINAGSPSGASNNMQILEGLAQIDPELLSKVGKVLPNDHFKILKETYEALGRSWTKLDDGVSIVLPPGGENGATPEIHQLAAQSGLVYADSGQLYCDDFGYIRLRTVSGNNPIVTSIYSRVNSDAVLFDPAKGITMRDPEEGTPFYLCDPYTVDPAGHGGIPVLDANGQKMPMPSSYTLPGVVDAILDRKLYLGGLNRVLDNKIILSTLCEYAPNYFKKELEGMGLCLSSISPLSPPETLPSHPDSIAIIEKSPEDWVIKAPNLSGGNGIYILKTMSSKEREEILAKIRINPRNYAYQRLVTIGRIPVAVREKGQYRYANIAADVRMWAFYANGKSLPRLTHNALIRTAPQEKGPLSSIVNTSKGGGYAPMLVVDDMGSPHSVSIREWLKPQPQPQLPCDLPVFAGAQLIQIAHLAISLRKSLQSHSRLDLWDVYQDLLQLKKQCREVLSLLHPKNMEPVNDLIEEIEVRLKKSDALAGAKELIHERAKWVSALHLVEAELDLDTLSLIEDLSIVRSSVTKPFLTPSQTQADLTLIEQVRMRLFSQGKTKSSSIQSFLRESRKLILNSELDLSASSSQSKSALFEIQRFMTLAQDHLRERPATRHYSHHFAASAQSQVRPFDVLFSSTSTVPGVEHQSPLLKINRSTSVLPLIATAYEVETGTLLTESDWIDPELRRIRNEWLKIEKDALQYSIAERSSWVEQQRKEHFRRHPRLSEYQALIHQPGSPDPQTSAASLIKLFEILPYAKYNFESFLRNEGLTVDQVFSSQLVHRKISILNEQARVAHGLNIDQYAGECFAQKRHKNGFFSDADIFLWVRQESSPLVQAYTVGHELIHFHQIREMMEAEQKSRESGSFAFSEFINYFGNYLGLASGALDHDEAHLILDRKRVYGLKETMELLPARASGKQWMLDLKKLLSENAEAWNRKVQEYGSLMGLSLQVLPSAKVKAIREVIPALENAKNIRFAKELGLTLPLDEVLSVLPHSNRAQRERYRAAILQAVSSPQLEWETLRIIASHQIPGIYFPRTENAHHVLTLSAPVEAIAPGGGYNQTQQ